MTTHTQTPRHLPHQRSVSVPDTPQAKAHAEEAEQLRADLEDLGIGFEQLSPTRDGRGHARLNFDQLSALLDLLDERDDVIAELKRELTGSGSKTD